MSSFFNDRIYSTQFVRHCGSTDDFLISQIFANKLANPINVSRYCRTKAADKIVSSTIYDEGEPKHRCYNCSEKGRKLS